jgi:hypothetical protein
MEGALVVLAWRLKEAAKFAQQGHRFDLPSSLRHHPNRFGVMVLGRLRL